LKVGLLSDPHANVLGLRAALAAIRDAGAEEIVCAGDAVGYYTSVNETIEELRRSGAHVVLGNHDAMLLGKLPASDALRTRYGLEHAAGVITADNLKWLGALPESLELRLGGVAFAVYHGSPWAPLVEYVYPDDRKLARFAVLDADVVVLGHTHRPLLRQVGDVTVVNPGSCGLPRDKPTGAPFAIVDTDTRAVVLARASYDEGAVEPSPFLDALRSAVRR
jgi:putative phosphoesterase